MEDDATRTPSPRSKSARPPVALFMEPALAPARPPEPEPERRPETEPEPPPETQPEAEFDPRPEAAPETPADAEPAPRRAPGTAAAARRATKATTPTTEKTRKAAKVVTAEPTAAPPKKRPVRAVAASATRAAPAKQTAPHPVVRTPWWARTPASAAAVPEVLAEAAVQRLGDSVAGDLSWLRDTYPQATADGLARLVIGRLAGRWRYTILAGPAGTAALLDVQARLVLHVAAAYGRDPRDPARVPELLALIRPTALAAPLVSRLAGCLLPGAGLLAAALADAGALDGLARRAVAYYRAR
jgi:hypothetical protein